MKQRPKQPEHYGNELLLITDIRIQSKTCHLSFTFKSIVEGLECVQKSLYSSMATNKLSYNTSLVSPTKMSSNDGGKGKSNPLLMTIVGL